MGILDLLQGNPTFTNDPAASNMPNPGLWGALNQPSPLTDDDAKKKAAVADLLASMGINPANAAPAPSPFPAVAQAPQPAPQPPQMASAAPFSFGGPGSMNVQPSQIAQPPQPAPAPQPALPAPVASAMAAAPPQQDQAAPIAVGSYQMPRIGSADDFEPDDEATPPAAKPTSGTAPGAPATAPLSLGGVASGIGDRLGLATKGFIGNLASGPIGALAGGLGALVTGKPTDAGTIASQKTAKAVSSTGQALLAVNAPPAAVQAAVDQAAAGNTKPLSDLFTEYYGKDKFQQSKTKNADGSETKEAFDVNTGKYTGGSAPAAPSKFSVDPELTGKDRLEALRKVDPLYAKKLEAMIAGDIPMPTGVAALRPDAKRTIEDALSIDGALSASDFATRASTRKDYASGIASRVTKSINTTIGHFATLDDSIGKLGNYSYFPKISNTVHDLYSSNMDPKYQAAKATFETNKEAAVKELDFALSGGHSSVSGSAELRDKFNRADSPEALHAAISEAMSLLQKRLESHTKAFTEGTKSQRDPQDFIYPENQQAFSRMLGQPAPSGTPSPAGAPKPGNYVWTPNGGLAGGK